MRCSYLVSLNRKKIFFLFALISMGTLLKEELNAKGALREDKRHFTFAVTRAPAGLVRLFLGGGGICSTMLPGGWEGTKGLCPSCGRSSDQQLGFLLSRVPRLLSQREGLAGQDQAVKAVEQFWTFECHAGYHSRQFQRVLLSVCWTSFKSTRSHCWRFDQIVSWGQCSGGGWENVLGKFSVSSLKSLPIEVGGWENAGLHQPLTLPKQIYFPLSKSTAKPPPTDFSSHTCIFDQTSHGCISNMLISV